MGEKKMNSYSEAEIQALIALIELTYPIETPNNNFYTFFPKTLAAAQTYFRRFALDLPPAFESLAAKGLAAQEEGIWRLTPAGLAMAGELRRLRPPIWYWYKEFYTAIEHSPAFSEYCRRVFGRDLGQHGFSNLQQLQRMLEIVRLQPSTRMLDIGCGNGKIAEYISDLTGAIVTGIDYIPEAIAQAVQRTQPKAERLQFEIGNLETLELAEASFNFILSIDSIFFGQDLTTTLARLKALLAPRGQMAIFCGDELAMPLQTNNLVYTVYDFSREHYEHLQLKYQVAKTLQTAFEQEGHRFIWENLMTESLASTAPYNSEAETTRRYLYHIKKS